MTVIGGPYVACGPDVAQAWYIPKRLVHLIQKMKFHAKKHKILDMIISLIKIGMLNLIILGTVISELHARCKQR